MLFTKNYSTIITKGLGAPACCALITAHFGINCGCTVEVITPPEIGGGGGSFAVSGFYVPLPKNLKKCDRVVLLTVKFSEKQVWRKSYVVDVCNVDKMVKVVDFIHSLQDRMKIGVEKFKTVSRVVTAAFTHK